MKRFKIFLTLLVGLFLYSCGSSNKITKEQAYAALYSEKPLAIALMPPINKTNNVEAKEFFYLTLAQPICERGYYVVPSFLCMEMYKNESAYDSELFINGSVKKFGEVLGADAVLFTTINKWEKSAVWSKVYIQVEYTLKSTKTDEILFDRIGDITYDASVGSSGGGLVGALVGMAVSALNTAAIAHVKVARTCNAFTLSDMPASVYSPNYDKDQKLSAGPKEFQQTIR
ncbi:MAG: DUF799 domain-containing protein [Candidatus Azobacteroides sp.]|nr:DUF799 domain-containing protein [Candidatus Azobacteroides sp.]